MRTIFASLSLKGCTIFIRFGSSLYCFIVPKISISLWGRCTIYILPPGFSTFAPSRTTSSSVQSTSCLEIAFTSVGFLSPWESFIYGGFVVTTSKEAAPKIRLASLISPCTISILSSRWFNFTLRSAILAISSWISSAEKCSPSVFAERRSGMIPVPVPRSSTRSPGFTAAKPESSTASIPKQNPSVFWMICSPFL